MSVVKVTSCGGGRRYRISSDVLMFILVGIIYDTIYESYPVLDKEYLSPIKEN